MSDTGWHEREASGLVAELTHESWGRISPSIYETGRLVTLAPWLTGHAARVQYLLSTQRPDGGWGQPDGYGLVPTLSATEALLTIARREGTGPVAAASHGLERLFEWLAVTSVEPVPDTPAIELIVPALVESINQHLDALADHPLPGLDRWRGNGRLRLPAGMGRELLDAVRSRLASGAQVPLKLLHSLEVGGDAIAGARSVEPFPPGTIGGSPAATAAWLGAAPADLTAPAVRYLRDVVGHHRGPVPSVIPIAPFERAWVLSTLIGAGFSLDVPPALTNALAAPLTAPLGEAGMSGGAGLPPDADTTSVTMLTLGLLGQPKDLDCLLTFATDSHFCTWHGERTPSTSTNAHVLEAFGHQLSMSGGQPGDRAVVDLVSAWLCAQQLPDGSWLDKWHASPYYATMCCAVALHRYGAAAHTTAATATTTAATVDRAVEWILATQRSDGSWGRWDGTVEETSYAVQILLLTSAPPHSPGRAVPVDAAARGVAYLSRSFGVAPDAPLWHDKDLYTPPAIVRASALAALRLGSALGSALGSRTFDPLWTGGLR